MLSRVNQTSSDERYSQKEEKAHDDRIAAANAKIKQAGSFRVHIRVTFFSLLLPVGQTYEKKAKRKDRDAAEEHSRYVNLLSVVGPELSQEKLCVSSMRLLSYYYLNAHPSSKHSTLVTERHTAILSLLAASLSRTAEAEWARVCESIRRMSSIVGKVGECRAFLEGGWTAAIPDVPPDGTDADEKPRGNSDDASTNANETRLDAQIPPAYYSPVPSASSSASSSQFPPPSQRTANVSQSPPPPTSFVHPFTVLNATNTDSVRSIESLSNFPSPPTHFPLPSMLQQAASAPTKLYISKDEPADTSLAVPENNARAVLTDSPISVGESLKPDVEDASRASGNVSISSPNKERPSKQDRDDESQSITTLKPDVAVTQTRDDSGHMFVDTPDTVRGPRSGSEKSEDAKRKPAIERSESVTSSASVVANLRDKWTNEVSL